jgi:hypothetical protein
MTKTKKKKTPTKSEREPESWFFFLAPWRQNAICIAALYLMCLVLFRGIVLDDAAFQSGGDTASAHSYYHAGQTLEKDEGVDVLWMPFFFSGMPTFGNVAYVPHNVSYIEAIAVPLLDLLFLKRTWSWIVVHYFLGGLFMFLLMRVLRFSSLASLLAAAAFMLSPYGIGLAGEGHGTKLMALNYLPAVFLLVHMLLERRDALSLGLLTAAIGTLMLTNHMQIVYYVFMLTGAYLLYEVIADTREKRVDTAVLKTILFVTALGIGLCISSYIYLSVYEYSQFSIRGGGTAGTTGGLTWQYATNWSWHPFELVTFLVPGFFGFQLPYYWGPIDPWTNSTVYIGVVPVYLGLIAVTYARNRQTWFFILMTILAFFVSFGRNVPFFYELLFSVLPFFNKFRAPAMILHMIAFTVPILGAYGLTFLMQARDHRREFDATRFVKTLTTVLAVLGAGLLLVLVFKSGLRDMLSGSLFLKAGETEEYRRQYGQQAQQAVAHLKEVRFDILWGDTVKFLVIALVAVGATFAFFRRKFRTTTFAGVLVALLVFDLYLVDEKLIEPQPKTDLEENFRADATIEFLKEQPGLFRVFPIGRLFGDNTYAYHGIHSVGGYSAAKLKIYQTMIDSCLYRGQDPSFPVNMAIVNMLGARYFIVPGELPPGRFTLAHSDPSRGIFTYHNPHALPRAFLVDETINARSDTEVFAMLNSPAFDPSKAAVLQDPLPAEISRPDTTAEVRVVNYQSSSISIETTVSAPALLVLSEVFYPAGWKAFVDGEETPVLRTNSILRSVVVPAGSHTVVFSFEPPAYEAGWKITHAAWIFTALLLLVPFAARTIRKKRTSTHQAGTLVRG